MVHVRLNSPLKISLAMRRGILCTARLLKGFEKKHFGEFLWFLIRHIGVLSPEVILYIKIKYILKHNCRTPSHFREPMMLLMDFLLQMQMNRYSPQQSPWQ